MTSDLPGQLAADMREFAYWKNRRIELIRAGLAADMPVARIAAEMCVAKSVVDRIKNGQDKRQ